MAGTADALGYQKINTLEEVESMPSFLEKQVNKVQQIQQKQAKQKEDNAKVIGDLLDGGAKDAYMFNDFYQKKFKEFRDYVVDEFAKNPNTPYNVLNDTKVKQMQIELMHYQEAGKSAEGDFNNAQKQVYQLGEKGLITPEEQQQRINGLRDVRQKVLSQDNPVMGWTDGDVQNSISKLTTAPPKPFDEIKALNQVRTLLPKATATGQKDEQGNLLYARDPQAINEAASAFQQSDQAYSHYAKIFKDIPPDQQKEYAALAQSNSKAGLDVTTDPTTGIQAPDPIKAYMRDRVNKEFGGTSIEDPSKVRAFNSVEELRKSQEYANYNKPGVNITKTYNGGYTNGKDNLTPNKNLKQTDNDGYSFKPSETVVFNVDGKSQKINATEIVFNPKTKQIYVSGKNADGDDFEKNVDWDTNIDNMKAAANKMGMQGMIEQAIADSQGTTPTGTVKKQLPTK